MVSSLSISYQQDINFWLVSVQVVQIARIITSDHKTLCHNIWWNDAKRAYLKFINNEIIMRHIERNPCTLIYIYI